MSFDLDKAFAFLNGLSGIPVASLVLILCLVAGFIFKRTPWIPNEAIPLLICLVGAVVLPLLSDFKTSSVQSVRVFFVKQAVIGFIAGGLAWAIHKWAIKRLLKKFGIQDSGDTKPPSSPAVITAPIVIAAVLCAGIGIGGPLPWA